MSGSTKAFLAAVLVAATWGGTAQASTVLDYAPTFPDVYVGNIAINYTVNAGRGVLTAKSTTSSGTYKPSSSILSWTSITGPTTPALLFDLSIAINTATGHYIPADAANHLVIQSNTTNYVTATNLTDFVLQGNDIFGFGFIPSSGVLVPSGRKLVVQLNDPTGIFQGGSYITAPALTTAFTSNNAGYVDNFAVAVPLPSGVWMGLAGLAAVGGMKLIHRRREALAGI